MTIVFAVKRSKIRLKRGVFSRNSLNCCADCDVPENWLEQVSIHKGQPEDRYARQRVLEIFHDVRQPLKTVRAGVAAAYRAGHLHYSKEGYSFEQHHLLGVDRFSQPL